SPSSGFGFRERPLTAKAQRTQRSSVAVQATYWATGTAVFGRANPLVAGKLSLLATGPSLIATGQLPIATRQLPSRAALSGPAHGQRAHAPPQCLLDLVQEGLRAQRPAGVRTGSHCPRRRLLLRLAQARAPVVGRPGRAPGPQVEHLVWL